MKNKDRSSSYCNNRCHQFIKRFFKLCKRFGHNIETCYHHNKSTVSISTTTITNTESVQLMAPVSTQSKSSDALSPCLQMALKTSSPMSFVWLVMHLIPLLSQLYLVCLLPLGLWIPLVAIT